MNKYLSNQIKIGAILTDQTKNSKFTDVHNLDQRRFNLFGGKRMFQPLPWQLWFTAVLLAFLSFTTVNPELSFFSIILVPVLASLLWFPGEPPALLYSCLMQWLQASAAIFYTDFYGLPLSQEGKLGSGEIGLATWLSLVGVLVLAVGMRMALIIKAEEIIKTVADQSRMLRIKRIFLSYIIIFVLFPIFIELGHLVPQLRQPIVASLALKWVFIFLLAYSVMNQGQYYKLLFVVVCLEFFTGILGYFSEFKDIFLFLLVVMPSAKLMFGINRLMQLSVAIVFVLVLGVMWTAVKTDYRVFLNDGSGQQEVVVPVSQRVEKLGELLSKLESVNLGDAVEQLILRVSYVSFFAATLENVPGRVPYENGNLWLKSLAHIFTPRVLFPDKDPITESELTTKYSGIKVATDEEGTTITIGYMAESYVDFGPIGMFVPILLLGLFIGLIYRFFVFHYQFKLLGMAIATPVLIFGTYSLGISGIKLLGGTTMSLIVMGLFAKTAGPWFWEQITIEKNIS